MTRLDPPWSLTASGSLALDFVNTLEWRGRSDPSESLHVYRDLLRFALAAGAVDRTAAGRLAAWAEAHPAAGRRVLAHAIRLRETMAAIFQPVARGGSVPQESLAALADTCRDAWDARELRPVKGGASWTWRATEPVPEHPAWMAALAAERLLVDLDRPPVRECAGEGCGWLFLDTSRNHSRRWCSMKSCGNRAKVRRFYLRTRSER